MTHVDIINKLIAERGYTTYLSLGSESHTVGEIFCRTKICVGEHVDAGVDIVDNPSYFFSHYPWLKGKIDIIFVDHARLAEQVIVDIRNAVSFVAAGGVVVIHDCLPDTEETACRERKSVLWTGDVWKAAASYFSESPYMCYTVSDDFGCGIVDTLHERTCKVDPIDYRNLTWDDYIERRDKLLLTTRTPGIPKIKINYTAYTVNNWCDIFSTHMLALKKKILDKHDADVSIFSYPDGDSVSRILRSFGISANVMTCCRNLFEFPAIRDLVHNRKDINLYFHTKSVSRPGDRNEDCWNRFMTHFDIEEADKCIPLLETNDCVGVEFRKTPFIHYSGNFWWSTGEHLAKLVGSPFLSDSTLSSGNRFACEMAICSVDGKYFSRINSGCMGSLYRDYFCNDGDWDDKPSHVFTIKNGILHDRDNAAL